MDAKATEGDEKPFNISLHKMNSAQVEEHFSLPPGSLREYASGAHKPKDIEGSNNDGSHGNDA